MSKKKTKPEKDKIVKKAVDTICWLAKKTDRKNIVLHSFGHLSDSKSGIKFAEEAIKEIKDRLAHVLQGIAWACLTGSVRYYRIG